MSALVLGTLLLAAALLLAPGPVDAARRLAALDRPGAASRTRSRPERPDPWREAGGWDELAACLRAGLSLDRAVRAVAESAPPATAAALTRVADLVALGADPAAAWAPALDEPTTARLARAARRSARSGAAVAEVATAVAADVRAEAAEAVAARAERAGVLVAGPLGLCFLPAFLALGIAPVVIGLASPLLERT
ncbi:type II secretion system F family protein [Actinomycetospora sp. CA-084318]|uniref:type II secretion system F family protein n=1 Tax=Actinomycetospora sp. CA-084318 TaxID=3239892 RepID=UPI003D951C63